MSIWYGERYNKVINLMDGNKVRFVKSLDSWADTPPELVPEIGDVGVVVEEVEWDDATNQPVMVRVKFSKGEVECYVEELTIV